MNSVLELERMLASPDILVVAVPSPPRRPLSNRWPVAVSLLAVWVTHVLLVNTLRLSDDEGTYYSQATSFLRDGSLAPYTYWYDHPPIGWLQIAPLIGLFEQLFNPFSVIILGRLVVLFYALATTTLLYGVARRVGVTRLGAVMVTLLWGLSPLAASISTQLYLDNIGMPLLLGSFYLALNRRHDLFLHLSAGVVFALAVLTKETYVLALPGLLWALAASTHRSNRAFSLVGFGMTFVLTGLAYPLMALNRSELLPPSAEDRLSGIDHVSLLEGVQWQLNNRAGSGWILDPTSDAHQTLMGWLALDPVLPLLGLGATILSFLFKPFRPFALAASLMVVVAIRPSGYLPLMYIISLMPFFALLVIGVVENMLRFLVSLARGSLSARLRFFLTILLVTSSALSIGTVWLPVWRNTLTVDQNTAYRPALRYVADTIPAGATIVSDDVFWVDLVDAGRSDDGWNGPLWFPKYELDPVGAAKNDVNGYTDINYVVSTNVMRSTAQASPRLKELYSHLEPMVTFGTGDARIDVFRVTN